MTNAEASRLIDDLKLTRREERVLRKLMGLSKPEPSTRMDRILQRPLKTPEGVLIAAILLVLIIVVVYWGRKWLGFIDGNLIILLLLSFTVIFDLRVRDRLIRKLYSALDIEIKAAA